MNRYNLKAIGLICLIGTSMLSVAGQKPAQPARYRLPYDISIISRELAEPAVATVAATPAAPSAPAKVPYWVDIVNADLVSNGGEGVYIAVLDTGLLPQWTNYFPGAQIKTEWGKGFTHDITWDTAQNDLVAGPLREDRGFLTDSAKGSGHGTHVTSTMIGFNFKTATADFKVQGVAPAATIIPVLVLDAWEVSSPTGIVQLTGGFDDMIAGGLRYVADLAVEKKIKIIANMSLGGSEPTDEIRAAVDYAISKGVIVVASAGNSGTDGMGWPGAYPEVISAAGGGWSQQWITFDPPAPTRWWLNDVTEKLNTKDVIGNNWQTYLTDFSSRPNPALGQSWKQLDVCAPGAAIVGPFKDYFDTTVGYYYLYGTSMAAPHVTGIAAVVAQVRPSLNQAQMENILKQAATHITMPSDGAVIIDPVVFSGNPPAGMLKWTDHDYGTGWLTLDWALWALSFQGK
jgi:subtilisin family serine protease